MYPGTVRTWAIWARAIAVIFFILLGLSGIILTVWAADRGNLLVALGGLVGLTISGYMAAWLRRR